MSGFSSSEVSGYRGTRVKGCGVRVRMRRSIGLVNDPVYIYMCVCVYVSKGYTTPQYTDSGEHSLQILVPDCGPEL